MPPLERGLAAGFATIASIAALHWVAAQIAALAHAGQALHLDAAATVRATALLLAHPTHPAAAWPPEIEQHLPGPLGYWAITVATLTLGLLGALAVARFIARRSKRGARFGVHRSARLATSRELAPLIVRGRLEPGRFSLGRVGRRSVATEIRRARRGRGVGDRTSVAIVGPTRCGKTAAAITGILEWTGPAVLSSVKSDLMGATIEWRRSLGEVRVFDPTSSTGEPSCGWSPLRAAGTQAGAQKAARGLVDAGPRAGADNLDFWLRLAEQTLWPHLYIAALHGRTMRDVARWITTQEAPDDPTTDLGSLVTARTPDRDPRTRIEARDARDALVGLWNLDRRTRSSAYATAQTLIGAWTDPGIAEHSDTEDVDLAWLLEGTNTLYICGPLHEQARLAPVFGGLLGDLTHQAYESAARTDQPIRPTLLVLDEAANTPTRWLPEVASTCAGIGLLLVTVWQAKTQLDAAYGRHADTVLTNHGTKIFFSGISDLATLDYASRLLGDEEVPRTTSTVDETSGHRTHSHATQRTQLLPSHVLRQTRPGNALLVHGSLPPAQLTSRPYYRERSLRARVPFTRTPRT